jgi:membrane fusion protein, multidrug efflux system
MTTTSRWTARVVAALVVPLSLAGCGRQAATPAPAAAPASEPLAIEYAKVTRQPLDVQLTLPGELRAYQSVDIHPRVTGFVQSISVDRGSLVRAGAVIAVLDAPELIAQRAQAQSALQSAEAKLQAARSKADGDRSTFDRLKAASATPGVVAGNDVTLAERAAESSRSEVAAAGQAVESARQVLAATREMEAYLRVTAPFDGVVTARNVHPGALVGPAGGAAAPLVTIAQTRRLRLVVAVPEAYTGQISTGASLSFSVAAYPGRTFLARIARIAGSVDAATRTMAVELDVDNADDRLAPGAFCQVGWPVKRADASLFVPTASVASTTGRTFVIRVRNGKTEWVDVKTGLTAGAVIEVFGNLAVGDVIAARGTDELHPGTPVRQKS